LANRAYELCVKGGGRPAKIRGCGSRWQERAERARVLAHVTDVGTMRKRTRTRNVKGMERRGQRIRRRSALIIVLIFGLIGIRLRLAGRSHFCDCESALLRTNMDMRREARRYRPKGADEQQETTV
jgi:hypothetical protein